MLINQTLWNDNNVSALSKQNSRHNGWVKIVWAMSMASIWTVSILLLHWRIISWTWPCISLGEHWVYMQFTNNSKWFFNVLVILTSLNCTCNVSVIHLPTSLMLKTPALWIISCFFWSGTSLKESTFTEHNWEWAVSSNTLSVMTYYVECVCV